MPVVLLDGRQLAEQVGASYAVLMEMARVGEIPSIKLGNGRRVFNLDLVCQALMEREAQRGPKLAAVGQE